MPTPDPLALAAQLRGLDDRDLIDYFQPTLVDVVAARHVLAYLTDSGCRVELTAISTERGLTSYALACAIERWVLERDAHHQLTAIPHDTVLTVCAVLGIAAAPMIDSVPEQVRTALLPAGHGSTHVTRSFPHPPRRSITQGW